jgi:exonuclease VII small subunit
MLVGSVEKKDLKVEVVLAKWQRGASIAKQQGTRRPWETGQ